MTKLASHEVINARLRTIGHMLRRIIQAVIRRRVEQQAIRELRSVSDALLHDIGIERSNIRTVVRQMLASADRIERVDIAAPAAEIVVGDTNGIQLASNDENLELVA